MKQSYLLLGGSNLLLLGITAVTGLLVQGEAGWTRHFLLGLLACVFTSFVNVVFFIYFVVQEKIVSQAAMQGSAEPMAVGSVRGMKSRSLRLAMVAIASIFVTGGAGAAIGILIPPEVHLLVAFAAVFVNGIILFFQASLLDEYRALFGSVFGE